MTFLRALLALLRLGGFRRLFVARIASQGSDGVFQVALASHVLFNPEQAADARTVAFAFSVLLLPYSFVGPFAGVLLDRWPRRRVMVAGQLIRAAVMAGVAWLVATASADSSTTPPAFLVLVLLIYSVNRFVLTGLSASLPHVVDRDDLVSANSIAPTCGSLAYLLGGVVGAGVRAVSNDVVVVSAAAAGVLLAALAAARLPFVGPDADTPGPHLGQVLRSVATGFVEAARTLPRRAMLLLGLILATRAPMGYLLLQSLLLFRGPLRDSGGVLGFGLAAGASAAGFALAAFITPWLAPRIGPVAYAMRMLALSGVVCASVGWILQAWSVTVIGFVVGLASQGVKITVDTLVQATVPDPLLGRAFSLYDMTYNAGLVLGAALAAAVLPESGDLPWTLLVVAALYITLSTSLAPSWRAAERLDARAGH